MSVLYWDVDLISLAATYLYVKTKNDFTIYDVLLLCEGILDHLEKNKTSGNRFQKAQQKFKFVHHHCEVNEKYLSSSTLVDDIMKKRRKSK